MSSIDRQVSWESYSPALRAVLDEYARAISDLEAVLGSLTSDAYISATSLSDDTFPNIRSIMEHVVSAAFGYADYIDDALQKVDRGRRERSFDCSSARTAVTSVWDGFAHMVAVLKQASNLSDDETIRIEFTTRWGERYNMEQLLEHAICHILRHRRQMERWIAVM